jgi:ubiquitin carboxyl-terminal hydrolase 2/21
MSTGRSNSYSRPLSVTRRPMPPTVSNIARSIQSGSMNLTSNTIRQRQNSGLRQTSTDRGNIPSTIPSVQRRTSTDIPRPRLTSVSSNERRESNATNDESSDDQQKNDSPSPPLDSRLRNGGLTGLQNLGNTCFMNSVLQCLSNTKPLLQFCLKENLPELYNTSSTSVMKGALMREYANLINKMWTSSDGHSIVSPSSFKNTVGRFAPRFVGYAQQDSQEFLRYLLQGLHEDVNRVQRKPTPIKIDEKAEEQMNEKDRAKLSWERCLRYDNSDIADIFTGQLKSTLECTHCQYQSITFDMFWDLSIPLPRNKSSCSVQECIQLFMSKEELDGNEKPMCAKCKQKRRCMKKFSIQKCPLILVLHLKRFSQARSRSKLNTDVDFPINNLKLDDLTDVMSKSYEGPIPTYNLIGISNHSGTVYSGHYIAQCKHPFTQQWHEFNDASVYSLNEKSRIISSNAYVLFYERDK